MNVPDNLTNSGRKLYYLEKCIKEFRELGYCKRKTLTQATTVDLKDLNLPARITLPGAIQLINQYLNK